MASVGQLALFFASAAPHGRHGTYGGPEKDESPPAQRTLAKRAESLRGATHAQGPTGETTPNQKSLRQEFGEVRPLPKDRSTCKN